MKTIDRSLEIVAVGLGQAGGNLAAEFSRRGYAGLAFNTARTDLSSLGASRHALPDDQRIYIGLEGHDGAGSDVAYGRECIRQHADLIRDAVQEHAEGADVLVLAAGLGGGTGSSLAQLVELLDELDLPTVVMTTLPHAHESGIAKVNALYGVRDLAATPTHGWALFDNARLAKCHHDAPIDSYFETINQAIVEPLDVFNRLNERESVQAIRSLDGEDFRNLLLTGGVLNYHSQELAQLSSEGVLDAVRGALSGNPMMPTGFAIGDIAYLGLVIEASERALQESPFSLYEEIAEHLKSETGGAAVYQGLYRNLDADGPAAVVRLIASSNALPSSIGGMLAEAEREASSIQTKAQQSVQALDLRGLDGLHLTRRPARNPGHQGGGAVRPKRARQSFPTPPAQSAATAAPAQSAATAAPKVPDAPAAPSAAKAAPATKESEKGSPRFASGPIGRAFEAAADAMKRTHLAGGGPAQTASATPSQVEALRRLVAVGDADQAVESKPPQPTPSARPASAPQPTPSARPASAPQPAPSARPASAPQPAPSAQPAGAPQTATRGGKGKGTGTDRVEDHRQRFERLCEAYRGASEGDSKRVYIGRELVAALRSDEAIERLHAVAAMARLDPGYFREALQAAVDDSDHHVSDTAKRALRSAQ